MTVRVSHLAAAVFAVALSVAAHGGDFSWKGAALSAWTNETNSIRSYELTEDGLVVRMAHWRDACIAVDFADPPAPGLDWEIAFRAKVVCPETGRVAPEGLVKPLFEGMRDFANSESTKFSWRADGKWHDYCVRAFNGANGRALKRLKLRLPPEGYSSGVVTFSEISVRRRPVAPEMSVMCAEADGFARPGAEVELRVRACNRGTSDAIDAKLVPSGALPGGVKWISLPPPRKVVEPGEAVTFRAVLESDAARDFVVAFSLSSGGCAAKRVEVPVKVGKAPVAEKSAGVPEPRPPKCTYDVAACYYPGWMEPERWKRIERVAPERKPLLGWYDEANPEVIDWQIKWYAEHGIGVLMLDWYWTQGNLRLDHFVQAYKKARWRKYLKWMVVWCNESQKPIHTPEDNRRVTKYWIDNYFGMDEYYRIDGEPVVGIFVLDHYIRDFGEAGTAKMLEESRQMARDAGYKGIHFVVFMRPEDDVGAIVPRRFRKLGASSFAHYNPHSAAGRGESFDRYSWKSAIEFNAESWRLRDRSGVPFWPVASSGWDDRPWNGRCEVYGRSAADFRKLLSEMKEFADSTGRKRVMVGPINEWGEGSYIEPCRQFGFSMYDAIRDVFCEKPPEGWPENLVPSDVGLGPYDFKETVCDPKASVPMDFRDGGTHGWKPMQGHVKEMRPGSDGLHVVPVGPTPGIFCDYQPFEAGDFGRLKVRLKVLGDKPSGGNLKVYWRSEGRQWCEAAGIGTKLSIDGKWHDYELDLSSRPAWSRRIFAVRIQPSGANMPEYVIESVEFLRK